MLRSGLSSMASRRVITSSLCWSDIIRRRAHSSPQSKREFVLHKMYEISGLAMGDIPYEEYVPSTEELHMMDESAPLIYATYWKVLCHFHICAETTSLRSGRVRQMAWASYLFNSLEDKTNQLIHLVPSTDA